MIRINQSNRFKGIASWDYYFMMIAFVGLIGIMGSLQYIETNPEFLFIAFGLIAILCVLLYAAREHTLRTKSERISSILFLDGWTTTGSESGEEVLIGIKKIKKFQELTEKERTSVDIFCTTMNEKITKRDNTIEAKKAEL